MSSYLSETPALHNLFNVMGIIPKGFIIFFTCIACSFLLKYKLYNHKVLSLFIILIGIVIYTSSLLIWFFESHLEVLTTIDKNHRRLGLEYMFFMFLVSITLAIQEVTEKWLLHYKFFNPFFILLFEGCSQMILLLVYIILSNHSFPTEFFSSKTYTWFTILYTFNRIIQEIMRIQTNNHFTPSHRAISDALNSFFLTFCFLFIKDVPNWNGKYIALSMLGYSLCFIGTLIYNEFIILNFGGFNRYTKEHVEKRAIDDLLDANQEYMELYKDSLNRQTQMSTNNK